MAGLVPADTLKDYIGKDMGTSDWLEIDQDRINQFADVTLDHQFIHVDAEKATPLFGSTIAHGFLSLLSHFFMLICVHFVSTISLDINRCSLLFTAFN